MHITLGEMFEGVWGEGKDEIARLETLHDQCVELWKLGGEESVPTEGQSNG